MLTINETSFGLDPADIRIRDFRSDHLLVLDGAFTVDTAAPEYAGIRPMRLTVEDLPFAKSLPSTALVRAEVEGVHYATVTKVRITDARTLEIDKVLPYKAAGSYRVRLSTMLIPERKTGAVVPHAKKTYSPEVLTGSVTGFAFSAVETGDWMMCALKADTLAFDGAAQAVKFRLSGFPEDVSADEIPVFYNENLWGSYGSKCYAAGLEGGILTIRRDGAAEEPEGTKAKFTRFLIVR